MGDIKVCFILYLNMTIVASISYSSQSMATSQEQHLLGSKQSDQNTISCVQIQAGVICGYIIFMPHCLCDVQKVLVIERCNPTLFAI